MELDGTDDVELFRRVGGGDVDAFAALVRRHQAAMVAVAFAITCDRDQALDLTQEAFVKAWQRIREVRDPARLGAWLCGVVRFLARDQRRLDRRRAALRAEVPPPPPTATPLVRALTAEDERLLRADGAGPTAGRFGFVLHGLWPNSGGGKHPQWCSLTPRPSAEELKANLCMTPAPWLLEHEWAKHGSCMTRSPQAGRPVPSAGRAHGVLVRCWVVAQQSRRLRERRRGWPAFAPRLSERSFTPCGGRSSSAAALASPSRPCGDGSSRSSRSPGG